MNSPQGSFADGNRILDVIVIGAGLSGLGASAQLLESGYQDLLVLESAGTVGGVWRENRYPNLACDTPIEVYAYSFFPGDKWSSNFAPGAEILNYLQELADRFGISPKIIFNTRAADAVWDEAAGLWLVKSSDDRSWRARYLIWSGGLLSQPAAPGVEGIERFTGQSLFPTKWRDEIDLSGKRVAVVGAGATAIQLLPYAAEHADQVYAFVRTPSYVMPRPDMVVSAEDKASPDFAEQQRVRRIEWVKIFERIATTRFPMKEELVAEAEANWRAGFHQQVTDPHAREVLTPKYRLGCKRTLFSNAYYPAVAQENVTLIGRGVARVEETRIVDVDGEAYEVDAIIWATGYEATRMLGDLKVIGRDGLGLNEAWSELPHAFFGVMVKGFPNFFLIQGPNTGGPFASDMVHSQIDFIIETMTEARQRGGAVIEVDEAAYRSYNEDVQQRSDASVLVLGNCNSFYRVGGGGKVFTHWPDTFEAYRTRIKNEAPKGISYRRQAASAQT